MPASLSITLRGSARYAARVAGPIYVAIAFSRDYAENQPDGGVSKWHRVRWYKHENVIGLKKYGVERMSGGDDASIREA